MKIFTIREFVKYLVVLLSLPMSCNIDDDDGVDGCNPYVGSFKARSMDLKTYVLKQFSLNEYKFVNSTVARADSFLFRITVSESILVKLKTSLNFSWGNQLFARAATSLYGKSIINSISISAKDTIITPNNIYLPHAELLDLIAISD